MKELKLLQALNDLDDGLIMDALQEDPRPIRKFRPSLILAAAVIISVLTVSVGAVITEAGWFLGFFEEQSRQKLTQRQIAVVQASTSEIGEHVTLDGYTATLESVIADSHNCYIRLGITGPEGVAMDNEEGYGTYTPQSAEELVRMLAPVSGARCSGAGSWQNMEDENPNDNQVTILVRYAIDAVSEVNFETEKLWRLTIRNLSAWGKMGQEDILLVNGDMCFDITFDRLISTQLDFIREPVPYTFHLPGRTETVEGMILSCTLRPMSGEMVISGCDEAAGFLMIPVVMRDGSRVEMRCYSWGGGSYSFTLKAPIDPEDVDHILLEDGTKLYPVAG